MNDVTVQVNKQLLKYSDKHQFHLEETTIQLSDQTRPGQAILFLTNHAIPCPALPYHAIHFKLGEVDLPHRLNLH
jgi:hypothetical protein